MSDDYEPSIPDEQDNTDESSSTGLSSSTGFEIERIAKALGANTNGFEIEQIAEILAQGGSGNSGLGFTPVYYDPSGEQDTSLKFVKNGNLVPFTVSDFVGESAYIKTVPILVTPPTDGFPGGVLNMMKAFTFHYNGMSALVFSGLAEAPDIVFGAAPPTNYEFVYVNEASESESQEPVDDGGGDNPPK